MCLIVFACQAVPGYRLVLAANRDEFYERPTLPARFRGENSEILAGKDLVAGGTWLGIHKKGCYAALTNYRDMSSHNPDAKSRGHLVKNYLENDKGTKKYLESIHNAADYNGFNLIAGDPKGLYHFTNQTMKTTRIQPGIHGISNAVLNTPWPKVKQSKEKFQELIENRTLSEEKLFKLLLNTKTYPEESLPKTGLPAEMEKSVSSIFIISPDYGTRCSTILFIKDDGSVRFVERTFFPGTSDIEEETGYDFKITD